MSDCIARLCPTLLFGDDCDAEHCPYVHLSDLQLTTSDLLRMEDVYALDRLAQDDSVKVPFTESDLNILHHPKLVLCFICRHPISPENDFYFECCDIFSCANCAEKQYFRGHCPRCGSNTGLVPAPPEKVAEVARANEAILRIPIARGLGL
jgi:hypothetical protein